MKVKVNWDLFNSDLKKYGITAQDLSLTLGKNRNYITNMRNRGEENFEQSTVSAIEKAMFKPDGAYCIAAEEEPKEDADLSIFVKLLNEQLVELKALRQDLASMKQELLSVQNAIRDKVAFTHTAVTTMKADLAEIHKQLR